MPSSGCFTRVFFVVVSPSKVFFIRDSVFFFFAITILLIITIYLKMLYLDCSHGISGDMFVGALLDLGVDKGVIVETLLSIAEIKVDSVVKKGVPAVRFKVIFPEKRTDYIDLVERVKSLSLSRKTERTALSILKELAEAEAKVHGVNLSKVHLHEAADSVVDAVAAALALEDLRLFDSPIVSSTVSVGELASAALEIIRKHSIPTKYTSRDEITTPTGAAILASLVSEYLTESCPEGREGFGAGEKDFDYPNVLRVILG